jgi:RNA polymerase sigma factor (sigma-70 family)
MLADLRAMDDAAWRAAYDQYDPVVRRVLRRRFDLEPDDEDEIAACTWANAVRGIGGFDGRHQFGTWLCRIAINAGLNWWRERERDVRLDDAPQLPTHAAAPDDVAERRILIRRVLRLVGAPRFNSQRRAWEMNVLGYSSDEAAAELGLVSGQAAKVRAHRVRQVVQSAIAVSN